jgi:CheY-like chemotaxis protein
VKTILLVDDEYAIVEVLAHLLEEEGYAVLTASNGREALGRAVEKTPDLVITDQMMPVMSGTELLRALQKHRALRGVPVILITSAAKPRLRELRWADFLAKPFEFDELLRVVRRALRQT